MWVSPALGFAHSGDKTLVGFARVSRFSQEDCQRTTGTQWYLEVPSRDLLESLQIGKSILLVKVGVTSRLRVWVDVIPPRLSVSRLSQC